MKDMKKDSSSKDVKKDTHSPHKNEPQSFGQKHGNRDDDPSGKEGDSSRKDEDPSRKNKNKAGKPGQAFDPNDPERKTEIGDDPDGTKKKIPHL